MKIPLHQQQIEFAGVTFCFHGNHQVLKQVKLTIPYGQSVAIVGGNGAGKTTLVNLLARFYDPIEGQILLDGVDIAKLNPKKLRPDGLGDSGFDLVQGDGAREHQIRDSGLQ